MKTVWALMDNRRGSVGQAKGVLSALKELAPNEYQIVEKIWFIIAGPDYRIGYAVALYWD